MDPNPPAPRLPSADASGRLDSWKEIAAYLKRDVRTVQRWEKHASLPVYRHANGKYGGVYAHRGELDAWREQGRDKEDTAVKSSARRLWLPAAAAVPLLLLVAVGDLKWERPKEASLTFVARDWVLLTTFDNKTGERSLDGAIEAALEHELINSRFASVVPRSRVDDTLRLMKRPLETTLDAAVGREVCLRDGAIRALVTGRAEKFGATYVITASVVDPRDGRAVASVSEAATSVHELSPALRRLSNQLRAVLGETRDSIQQSDQQLEKVTTPSLEALRLYTESYQLGDRRQWRAALELAKQAVVEDPGFATAQIWWAWALRNLGHSLQAYEPIAARALQLSGRATDAERYWILGSYHQFRREIEPSIAAYELLLRLRPDHFWGMNNLIGTYLSLHRLRDAAALAVRMATAHPNRPHGIHRAAQALSSIGDFDGARPFVARLQALSLSDPTVSERTPHEVAWTWMFPAYEAWAKRDARGALATLIDVEGRLNKMPDRVSSEVRRTLYLFYLALGALERARAVAALNPVEDDRHLQLAQAAYFAGDVPTMGEELRAVRVATPHEKRGTQNWPVAGWLLIKLGRLHEAEDILDAWVPPMQRPQADSSLTNPIPQDIARARGGLTLARGQTTRAISMLREHVEDPREYGGGAMYRAADSLADALVEQGQLDTAADVLKRVLTAKDGELLVYQTGAYWIPLQVKLAELDHRLGRHEEAEALENDLAKLLALADPEFQSLRQLQRLRRDSSFPKASTHSAR